MWWLERNRLLIAGWIMLVLLGGCGYAFKSQVSKLPPDVRSMAVPIFKNHTHELGLENVMTRAVVAEFNRRKMLEVRDSDHADALLQGVIRSIRYTPVSFSGDERATERRVRLWLDLNLVRASDGKSLWRVKGLTYQEAYFVSRDDPLTTEFNKQEALRKIAENLAEKIHDYIFTAF